MKIRIKGNTVRFRLSKPEVAQLAAEGFLEEKTDFGNTTFSYVIKATQDTELSAGFDGAAITLRVPTSALRQWASTDMVGMERDIPLSGEKSLHLLLEKDFKCIDVAVQEDQSDYFENPFLTC